MDVSDIDEAAKHLTEAIGLMARFGKEHPNHRGFTDDAVIVLSNVVSTMVEFKELTKNKDGDMI